MWLRLEVLLILKIFTQQLRKLRRKLRHGHEKSSSGKYNQEEIKPSKLCLRKEEKNEKKTT